MTMTTFAVEGTTRNGYLAVPQSGNGAGVLVLHAWWGLTPFFTDLCDRLAAEGFTVFAPDLHHGKTAQTIEQAEQLMRERDDAATQATALSALRLLQQHPTVTKPQLGAVGFSMGGAWACELAEQVPAALAAAVLYYGENGTDLGTLSTNFLRHYGETDTWEDVEAVRAMQAANITTYIYPAVGHWFAESDRPEHYHLEAAELAWDRTVGFLKEQLR